MNREHGGLRRRMVVVTEISEAGIRTPAKNHLPSAIWPIHISHMAETHKPSERDYSVMFCTASTPESEIKSAFRSKWEWVVSSQTSTTAWYATVISNLLRSYSTPEKATLDFVRNTIAHGLPRAFLSRQLQIVNFCR